MKELTFDSLDLIEPIRRAIRSSGYTIPTPIQAGSIPALLDGRDLLGLARTGTGKTAAFALPTLQRLADGRKPIPRRPRALILTPTRELAVQVGRSFYTYGRFTGLKEAVIFGGVPQGPQARFLSRGVDIVVATPGRLMDLMNQGIIFLDKVEIFGLDEADRMLDMGFIKDIEMLVQEIPKERQSLFFSATMPPAVERLARTLLTDPVKVMSDPLSSTAPLIDQKVMFVGRKDKDALLKSILDDPAVARALIFTRTKHRANKVAERLEKDQVSTAVIHGNKSQGARQKALRGFSDGKIRVLVATDIAARGIDVEGVSHVINFELPNEPESYVHRIGRTARAGATGFAISFCDEEEGGFLHAIEQVLGQKTPIDDQHHYHSEVAAKSRAFPPRPGGRGGWRGGNGGGNGGGGGFGGGGGNGHRPNATPGGHPRPRAAVAGKNRRSGQQRGAGRS
jgi:ATP-dependent RNA helicase RhlE